MAVLILNIKASRWLFVLAQRQRMPLLESLGIIVSFTVPGQHTTLPPLTIDHTPPCYCLLLLYSWYRRIIVLQYDHPTPRCTAVPR